MPKFPHVFFGSDNTNMLSCDEFHAVLEKDGWISQADNQEAIQDLQNLSKEEIISYFVQE